MIGAILDLIGAIFLFFGAVLSLGAAVGLLRFPDVVTRMHAGAKPQTLGLLLLVLGATLSIRELPASMMGVLIIAFQFLTIPVSTHMVARTAYRTGLVARDSLVIDELADQVEQAHRPVPRPVVRSKGKAMPAKPTRPADPAVGAPTARSVDEADSDPTSAPTSESEGVADQPES